MRFYIAIIHKDDDSAFGLSFPDLPGCYAASDTWNGLIPAATEAIDLWFEDQPDVLPSSLDQIGQHPDVIKAGLGGIFAVPYIPADTAVERVNITLERGLLRAIDETAKGRGMTRSAFLASAARRELVGAA